MVLDGLIINVVFYMFVLIGKDVVYFYVVSLKCYKIE